MSAMESLLAELNQTWKVKALELGMDELAKFEFVELGKYEEDDYKVDDQHFANSPSVESAFIVYEGDKRELSRGESWAFPGWVTSDWGFSGRYECGDYTICSFADYFGLDEEAEHCDVNEVATEINLTEFILRATSIEQQEADEAFNSEMAGAVIESVSRDASGNRIAKLSNGKTLQLAS